MTTQRLIIDTDPGLDDAQAILMAAIHPAVQLEALTVVGGNVALSHCIRNCCLLADQIQGHTGQTIPVYAGCGSPLVFQGDDAAEFHGKDGFGDAALPDPTTKPQREHAANELVRRIREAPGEITVAAIGPLTNIALALHLEPNLPNLIKRFVVMGGAVTGKGNTENVTAEFNFFADPEAAYFVLDRWAAAEEVAEIVDWEATVAHRLPQTAVDTHYQSGKQWADFLEKITRSTRYSYDRDHYYGADPLALAVTLEPEIVTRAENRFMAVETSGPRGQSSVTWNDYYGRTPNTKIILEVDLERFQELIKAGILGEFIG